ncbi:hypothetical protein D3C81_1810520 [compost metagenome]
MGDPLGCIEETLISGVAVSVDEAVEGPRGAAAPGGFRGVSLPAEILNICAGLRIEGEDMFG